MGNESIAKEKTQLRTWWGRGGVMSSYPEEEKLGWERINLYITKEETQGWGMNL